MSLLHRATNAYRDDGMGAVIRKGGLKARDRLLELPGADTIAFKKSLETLRQRQRHESSLSDILDTAYNYRGYGEYNRINPLQVRGEIEELARTIGELDPDTVFEIGTANGGTLYVWSRFLNLDTAISLDLPSGPFGGGYSANQGEFYSRFEPETEIACFRRNSHDPDTYTTIADYVDEQTGRQQGVEFLFIDGDHTYEGVKQDFEMYRDLVADGGVIAFHDILPHPDEPDCNVDQFWNEIKPDYETREIIGADDQDWAGIGLVYV